MKIGNIDQMNTEEKLQAMEDLWDSLLNEESIKSPAWHGDTLAERRARIERGETQFMTFEEFKNKKY